MAHKQRNVITGESEPENYLRNEKDGVVSSEPPPEHCEIKKREKKYERRTSFYQSKDNLAVSNSLTVKINSPVIAENNEPKIETVGQEKRIHVKENRLYRHPPRHTTWLDDEDLANDDESSYSHFVSTEYKT